MSLKSLTLDAKWRLKYELFRRVLPRLGYEPFTIRRLSYEAWPKIAAITGGRDYSKGLNDIDWRDRNADDDGSEVLQAYAERCQAVIVRNYAIRSAVG